MRPSGFPWQFIRLFLHPDVNKNKKWLFALIIPAYWLLPDLIPLVPLDDLLFTLLALHIFTRSAQGDLQQGREKTRTAPGENVIDVEGEVVEEEEE